MGRDPSIFAWAAPAPPPCRARAVVTREGGARGGRYVKRAGGKAAGGHAGARAAGWRACGGLLVRRRGRGGGGPGLPRTHTHTLPRADGGGSRATMKQQQQPSQPPQRQPPPSSSSSAGGGGGAGVPAFLSKLWALVGEAPSNQLITWSQVRARPLPPTPPSPACAGRREVVRVRPCIRLSCPRSSGGDPGPALGGRAGPGRASRRARGGRKDRARVLGSVGLPEGAPRRLCPVAPRPLCAVSALPAQGEAGSPRRPQPLRRVPGEWERRCPPREGVGGGASSSAAALFAGPDPAGWGVPGRRSGPRAGIRRRPGFAER